MKFGPSPIPEYRLVTQKSQTDFVVAVNKALQEGWQLQGGVAVARDVGSGTTHYYQALTRQETPK